MKQPELSPHVMFIAGEASGDAHGAEVARHLKTLIPGVRMSGMGSRELKSSGVDVFYDSAKIAVVGLVEVIRHWSDIKQAMERVKQKLETDPPDLLVLIDYQEFNLKIARYAKPLGIKVLFYISPQVWAWRPKRIHKIGAAIDHMAVLFQFETRYYEQAGIPVTFVGHPLVDKVKTGGNETAERDKLGIRHDSRVVGLFPGSRRSEIARLVPVMLETAERLQQQDPALSFVMPVATTIDYDELKQQCSQSSANIILTRDNLYEVIVNCDAIVSCSGTVTLEIALLGVPLCIIYKMSWLSYQIMSRMITIEHIGLANIVADQHVVEEFLQDDANVETIGNEINRLLNDQDYRAEVKQGLSRVRDNLGQGRGSERMAELVKSLI